MTDDEMDDLIYNTLSKYGGVFGNQGGIARASQLDELGEDRQAILDRILGLAEGDRAGNRSFVDQQVVPELDKLREAAARAAMGDQEALEMIRGAAGAKSGAYQAAAKDATKSAGKFNEFSGDLWDELKGSFSQLDQSDRDALQRYLGETNPLMEQLKAQGWGENVTADPEALAAQQDVLGRFQGVSDTQATAQERFLNEMARRNFEAQDRGSREAVMQDLKQRGLSSGTLQIADQLAAREKLGQERTQAELGLQAGAVQRAMQGLEGYGGQANVLRSANDAINQFNKTGSQVAQRFQDQYAQDEAKRVGDLAGERQTTQQDTNKGLGDRAESLESSGQDMLDTNYEREGDAREAGTEAADVGYDTGTDVANATSTAGENAFGNQQDVVDTAGNVAETRSGATDPTDTTEALKLALGEVDLEEGLLKSK